MGRHRFLWRLAPGRGITLPELLVVVAMIGVLGFALLPVLQSTTDRSKANRCRTNLSNIGAALRMYMTDVGEWPESLLVVEGVRGLGQRDLRCTVTGRPYFYFRPQAQTPDARVVASCVPPSTPEGERPHDRGQSFLALTKGGEVVEMRGPVP